MSLTRVITALCRSAVRNPFAWFVSSLVLTGLSFVMVGRLALDTNLIRLLPRSSKAAMATRELNSVVGGGSYFTMIFEGDDGEVLLEAVRNAAAEIRSLEGVRSAVYENPIDFFEKYRYALVPPYYLGKIYDFVLEWQAKASPFVEDFGESDGKDETYGEREDRKQITLQLRHYSNLPRYHQSADGRKMGIFVRPREGVTNLGATRALFLALQDISADFADRYGIWSGVSGSLRNKVDEYDLIVSDLRRSGLIAMSAIVLTIALGFGSLRLLPVLLYPLAAGLLWSFALVPVLVGDLNTITAFLLLVLFGMGIDYSIHLVKRFQLELCRTPSGEPDRTDGECLARALIDTYLSTGVAIGASGLTTALALGVLAVSDFKGFSEFGIVGGVSVVMVLAAMYTVMPATLVLATRWGLVGKPKSRRAVWIMPGRTTTVVIALAVIAALVLSARRLSFDYDFGTFKARIPVSQEVKKRQREVYTTSGTPAAIYVAKDMKTLDRSLEVFETRKGEEGSTLGRLTSIRDLIPSAEGARERAGLIEEIREETRGSWVGRIEDEEHRRWIDELNRWVPAEKQPQIGELPELVKSGFLAQDGSGQLILGIYPSVERSHGRNAMAFTDELYSLDLPGGLRGPMGETPVFAEILWLVTGEGPWLIGLTFLGVFLLILLCQRSARETVWILLPLAAGIVLTFGVISAAGISLNFFSMVVIPALIGLGVDDGVHYYRRWKELGGDTLKTQKELFVPLTVTSATTMMGYSGMVFASHDGLFAIGRLACIGLALVWFTSLFLLPGLLAWAERR